MTTNRIIFWKIIIFSVFFKNNFNIILCHIEFASICSHINDIFNSTDNFIRCTIIKFNCSSFKNCSDIKLTKGDIFTSDLIINNKISKFKFKVFITIKDLFTNCSSIEGSRIMNLITSRTVDFTINLYGNHIIFDMHTRRIIIHLSNSLFNVLLHRTLWNENINIIKF